MTKFIVLPPSAVCSSEAGSLAFELAKARDEWLAYEASQHALKPDQTVVADDPYSRQSRTQRLMNLPPQTTSWFELNQLAEQDPDLATRRWEEIKTAARQELTSGHWAATAMESASQSCWQRAQFLALRDDLAGQWRPRNGIEWCLVDGMTQALVMQRHWMQRLIEVDSLEWPDPPSAEAAKWQPPRLSSSLALDQAAAMVDRFNRIFMRALRQLRDLRRYTFSISAQQVNIGQQQVNVAAAPEVVEAADERPVAILDVDGAERANDWPSPGASKGNRNEFQRADCHDAATVVTPQTIAARAAAIKSRRV